MRIQLQAEAAECGLACLAMLTEAHGRRQDLLSLRQRFPVGLKGLDLEQLMGYAGALGFSCRALRLDLQEMKALHLPCILHWNLDHFVVLERVSAKHATIIDPAIGRRRLKPAELSAHFSGVALELTPNAAFQSLKPAPRLSLQSLIGSVSGLNGAVMRILLVALSLQLFAVAAPLFNQLVVDEAISSGDRDLLLILLLGFGLLLLTQTALGLARSWMVLSLGQTLALQWRSSVFAHLIRLPVEYFERRHLGDISSRFDSVKAIQSTLTHGAIESVLDGVMALTALALMLVYSPQLSAVVLAAVVLYAGLRALSYAALRDTQASQLGLMAKEQSHILETLRAMAPIKLFGHEAVRQSRWMNLAVDVQNRSTQTAKITMVLQALNGLIFGLENLLVLWLGARQIMSAQGEHASPLTIGMLFAFMAYKTQFSSRVSALIDFSIQYRMISLHGERLADIVLSEAESAPKLDGDLAHLAPCIELRDVSFSYSKAGPPVLDRINLKIDAGESVVITGPSGAGKSTLLKVVLGLLQPTSGELLYGGVPVRQLGITNYRRCIASVLQEDALLNGSIADNIVFFASARDPQRLEHCARLAQCHEDIVRMPMGYHSLVGELGQGLSGGQRQRLLLARALYKQPRVLVLDEATSHLDASNERAIAAEMARLPQTRLIVSHRPEAIAGAQRVLQLTAAGTLKEPDRQSSAASPPSWSGMSSPFLCPASP